MSKNEVSRLDFLRLSALGATAVLLPSAASAITKPKKEEGSKNIVRLGFIGLGQQCMGLLNAFIHMDNVEVRAGCDVHALKRERFTIRVNKFYKERGKKCKIDTYEDYQEILSRDDIDAVVIAVPDHQHAMIGVAACRAKKDIYMEKPLTFTIKEGRALCEAVRQNCRILQVGSQQRSQKVFQHAVNMVHQGVLGKLRTVLVDVGGKPIPYDLPKQEIDPHINWDKWLGPLPTSVYYNEALAPKISIDPEKNETVWAQWRTYKETGGGMTTDWGAHMFDIAQWALAKDRSCPVRVVPPGCEGESCLTYLYDTGLVLKLTTYRKENTHGPGIKFIGERGYIDVSRGYYDCSNPEWKMPEGLKDSSHQAAFISSVLSRIDPNVTVEIGHSTCTMCTIGNIAYDLERPLDWNPIIEKFIDDPEADNKLHYTYRDGYSL